MGDEPNTTETGDANDFACPWCGAQQSDMWEVVEGYAPIEFDCGSCGKPIKITAIDWDWTAYFQKGDEPGRQDGKREEGGK